MSTAASAPDANVRAATAPIADAIPKMSAMTPAESAPMA
jgi:hypothetical protein